MKKRNKYIPSDKERRKYVSSMRNRIFAGLIAAVTAASPVITTAAELGGYPITSETDGSTESLDVNTDRETAAETVTDDSGTVSVTTEVGDTGNIGNTENMTESAESADNVVAKAEESEKSGEKTETKFLFINLAKANGGTVILNEGELDDAGKSVEKRVKLVTQTGTDELGNETTRTLINVYDKDDVLIDSEDAADNANIYVCEVKTDEVVTVKVVADDGYVVSKYDLRDRLVDGVKTDVGFDKTEGDDLTVAEGEDESSASDRTEFSYPVFMKDNMALTIELEEKQEKSGSKGDTKDDTAKDEEAVDNTGATKDTDLTVDGEVAADDSKKDMNADLTVDGEKTGEKAKDHETSGNDADNVESNKTVSDISGDTDNANTAEGDDKVTENVAGEDVNADESGYEGDENTDESVENVNSGEAENVDTVDMTGETHFIDAAENIGDLDSASFSTARLIILSDDSNAIIDPEHIIGNYDNIYLMQYKSVEQAMNAYAYYEVNAEAVEPDKEIVTAEETANDNNASDSVISPDDVMTEESNPIVALSETQNTDNTIETLTKDRVIALIDTGAHNGKNIIGRVSLIDDILTGGEHADDMVDSIVSQNEDAKIYSIRTIGNDGNGSISAVVAGIEYAINQHVDIINLSLYANKTLATTVLEKEIQKAIDAGITVVGAAGNDGADAVNYVPGSVLDAWVLGAADDNGNRKAISNYGDSVDYYAKAKYTSNAAAMFSGYISKYGTDSLDNSIFLKEVGEPGNVDDEDTKSDETTLFDPVIEKYIKRNIDTSYTQIKEMQIVNIMRVKNTMVDGSKVSDDDTIDSIMSQADISDVVIGQTQGILPVYQLDEDSDYWVAYVDTMKDDDNAAVQDVMIAQNDTKGITFDGWHFDNLTGLVYMPKSIFYEDGTLYVDKIQVQVMQKLIGFNWADDYNSTVGAVTLDDGVTNSTWTAGNIYADYTNIQVGKYLDVNNMLVTMNGIPVEGKLYGYEPETGILTLGFSPSVVQSIHVDAKKTEQAGDVEPGVKVASGYSFSEMVTINTSIGCGSISTNKKYLKKGHGEAVSARFCYPENNGYWSYYKGHESAVMCYRFTDYNDDSLDLQFCNWVLFNQGNINSILLNGKVWSMKASDIVPFVLNVNSFDAGFADFEELKMSNGKDVELALQCCHINNGGGQWNSNLGTALGAWRNGLVMMRIVNVNTTKKTAVCAIYTQNIANQHGIGLFAFNYTDTSTTRVKLAKRSGVSWTAPYSKEVYSLEGAKYRLYKRNSNGTEETVYYMKDGAVATKSVKLKEVTTDANSHSIRDLLTTNAKGNTKYIALEPGTYYIKEQTPSTGFYRCNNYAQFTVEEDDTTVTLSQNTNEALAYALSEQPKEGRLSIIKTNSAGQSTENLNLNAVFKIEYWDNYTTDGNDKPKSQWFMQAVFDGTNWVAQLDETRYRASWTDPNTGVTQYSDELFYTYRAGKFMQPDGINPVPTLPMGSFRVTEVQAPDGYKLPADPVIKLDKNKTQNIYRRREANDDNTSGYGWLSTSVSNEQEDNSRIQIKKVDETGNWSADLVNTEFTLYDANGNACSSITITDANYKEFEYDCKGGQTYTIKETKTPACRKTAAPITVTIGTGANYKKTYQYDIKNDWNPSKIAVSKKDGNNNWNNNLIGAQFTLYEGATNLGSITIQNQNAHQFDADVWPGHTYTIKETHTPAGFITAADISVTISTTVYQSVYYYDVKNLETPKVQITKQSTAPQDILDLSAYTVSGAEFGVYEDQACTKKVPNGTLTTKENGVTDILTLPCSADGTYTYWVREDKKPNGHKENNTPQPITVTLPADAGATKPMTFTNEPETDELSAFAQKLSSKGDPVVGTVFKVRLYDGKYTTVQECEAKGVLKKTWYLQSDEDGLVEFDKDHRAHGYTNDTFYQYDTNGDGSLDVVIPIGCTVTYQEVKTPKEYILDDTTQIWSEKDHKIDIKRYYNEIAPCKITIQKLSDDGKTPLQNVEFELTFAKESEPYTENALKTYKPLLKQGESIKAKTDANGYIVWSNLDQGEYKIVETKTVSGMSLLKDPINITLPITMTDKQAKDMSAATDQGYFDEGYTNKWYFYEAKFEVTNTPNFVMPTTGASGMWKFIFFGFGIMTIFGTGLIVYDSKNKNTRKRRKHK